MVVSIGVRADDGGMTGEVVLAELQAKGLRPLHGQAVLYCVLRVEADDIMVGLHVRRLFVKQYSTNDTATGCQDWLLFTPLGLKALSPMTTPPRCWPWDFLCLGAAHLYRGVTH